MVFLESIISLHSDTQHYPFLACSLLNGLFSSNILSQAVCTCQYTHIISLMMSIIIITGRMDNKKYMAFKSILCTVQCSYIKKKESGQCNLQALFFHPHVLFFCNKHSQKRKFPKFYFISYNHNPYWELIYYNIVLTYLFQIRKLNVNATTWLYTLNTLYFPIHPVSKVALICTSILCRHFYVCSNMYYLFWSLCSLYVLFIKSQNVPLSPSSTAMLVACTQTEQTYLPLLLHICPLPLYSIKKDTSLQFM